ncbi:hypothetical protein CLOP_g15431, partial [Closterium sp. NIES-67]
MGVVEEERSDDSHARDDGNGGESTESTLRGERGEETGKGEAQGAIDAGADEAGGSAEERAEKAAESEGRPADEQSAEVAGDSQASEGKGNEGKGDEGGSGAEGSDGGNQVENGGEGEGLEGRGEDAEEAAAPAADVTGGDDAAGEAEEVVVVGVVVGEAEGADEEADREGEGGEGEERREEQAEERDEEAEEEDEEGEEGEGEDEDEDEDEDEGEGEGEGEEGEEGSEGAGARGRRVPPRMSREARSIYERIRARQCRVARVVMAGNKRTKAAIISRIMAGALAQSAEAGAESGGSFEELQAALLRANRALRALGVFEDVTTVVDALPGDPPGTATVVINVKEDSVLAANVGTYLQ